LQPDKNLVGQILKIDSVIDSVVKFLTAKIITGEFPPGQKLNEIDLAANLDVSRPSLREALRILEQKHLIRSIPRKGCYVAELSIEDFTALYHARQMIECYAINLFEILGKRQLPELEATIRKTSTLVLPPDNDPQKKLEHLQALVLFHYRLVEACGNKHMLRFYNTIASNLARYQFIYLYKPNVSTDSYEDHRKILDHIGRGEYAKAKTRLIRHMSHFSELMRSLMAKEQMKDRVKHSQGKGMRNNDPVF
jgi:DNA-binding GntR family transcriptional regulator